MRNRLATNVTPAYVLDEVWRGVKFVSLFSERGCILPVFNSCSVRHRTKEAQLRGSDELYERRRYYIVSSWRTLCVLSVTLSSSVRSTAIIEILWCTETSFTATHWGHVYHTMPDNDWILCPIVKHCSVLDTPACYFLQLSLKDGADNIGAKNLRTQSCVAILLVTPATLVYFFFCLGFEDQQNRKSTVGKVKQ